jgi:esterase/lipase superfamily enzyme/uncharacterized protein YjbI with pentapeptide repeats
MFAVFDPAKLSSSVSQRLVSSTRWSMQAALFLNIACSGVAFAYDPQALEGLRSTRSCLDCDLSKADLSGVVHGAVDLRGANLQGAVLARADIPGARLANADLNGADLSDAVLEGASLIGASLEGANLEEATLREANLTRANLRGANLKWADLYQSSLKSVDLRGATLIGASLEGADLAAADLRGADLEEADLTSSSLQSADLRGAAMIGAVLEQADLRAADLEDANLEGAVLAQTNFDCANLAGVTWPEAASLTDRYLPPMQDADAADREPLSKPDDFETVRVFYGTDRCRIGALDHPEFNGERADWVTLGTVTVTVPKEHEIGAVERPWSFRLFGVSLEEENPAEHFTVYEITTLDESFFLDDRRRAARSTDSEEPQLFVFIHGYNMSFESAAFRTAQIAYDLDFEGAPVMYSWPSRGGLASYEYDQNSAIRSREFLRNFLLMLKEKSGAEDINVVAHSMGNLALMEVLRDIRISGGAREGPIFKEVVLAAPDIDRDLFVFLAKQIEGVAERVTLYASSNDWAMAASKALAGSVPRAGDVPEEGPLILHDIIETIDASAISTAILSLNHSEYAERSLLLNDIGRLWPSCAPPPSSTPVTGLTS